MNRVQEKQLFDALRGPIQFKERVLNEEADAIAILDVYAVQPVIDEIERNAEARGRFAQLLEDANALIWKAVTRT